MAEDAEKQVKDSFTTHSRQSAARKETDLEEAERKNDTTCKYHYIMLAFKFCYKIYTYTIVCGDQNKVYTLAHSVLRI